MKIVALIPAFNEEKTIERMVTNVTPHVDTVVVIDDGSRDKTAQYAEKAGAVVVSHHENRGVGAAVKTGVEKGLQLGADILVSIDADEQFRPEDIPRLIAPIMNDEADFVTGSRFLGGSPKMPRVKRVGNTLFTWLVNMLTHSSFTDTQCGFRAMSREAALRITLFGDFTYTQETFLDLISKKMRMKEVPVKVAYDVTRKSRVVKNPLSYGVSALLIIVRTIVDLYPFKIFGILGSVIFASGAISGLALFVRWVLTSLVSPYRSLVTLSGVLLIVGFLCVILALIADMLGRQKKIQEEILYYARVEALERRNSTHEDGKKGILRKEKGEAQDHVQR
ncbi:MAG: glycosyltransferase family 2 protein [Theionarchaea archaeon]|nr:glycosyltransferase family 2 protein [Theionarchaea archaeon]MBU7038641.1 glycosyltransferase family 2 protein [Theionarchaea archaeon]